MRALLKQGDFIRAGEISYTIIGLDKYPKPKYKCLCIQTVKGKEHLLHKISWVNHEDVTSRYVDYDEIVFYSERMTELIQTGLSSLTSKEKQASLIEIANMLGLDMSAFKDKDKY